MLGHRILLVPETEKPLGYEGLAALTVLPGAVSAAR
jgi:hypothetical protein